MLYYQISYQNKVTSQTTAATSHIRQLGALMASTRRRRFDGTEKVVPAFITSLKRAQFTLMTSREVTEVGRLRQKGLDFMWLLQTSSQKTPLFTGFFSRFVTDCLPQTVITYMDPISQPLTGNDVVQETMVRSFKVADETKQSYAVVSYDLAAALKSYSIQALQAPAFDKRIILLGNVHLELAYFGALEHS